MTGYTFNFGQFNSRQLNGQGVLSKFIEEIISDTTALSGNSIRSTTYTATGTETATTNPFISSSNRFNPIASDNLYTVSDLQKKVYYNPTILGDVLTGADILTTYLLNTAGGISAVQQVLDTVRFKKTMSGTLQNVAQLFKTVYFNQVNNIKTTATGATVKSTHYIDTKTATLNVSAVYAFGLGLSVSDTLQTATGKELLYRLCEAVSLQLSSTGTPATQFNPVQEKSVSVSGEFVINAWFLAPVVAVATVAGDHSHLRRVIERGQAPVSVNSQVTHTNHFKPIVEALIEGKCINTNQLYYSVTGALTNRITGYSDYNATYDYNVDTTLNLNPYTVEALRYYLTANGFTAITPTVKDTKRYNPNIPISITGKGAEVFRYRTAFGTHTFVSGTAIKGLLYSNVVQKTIKPNGKGDFKLETIPVTTLNIGGGQEVTTYFNPTTVDFMRVAGDYGQKTAFGATVDDNIYTVPGTERSTKYHIAVHDTVYSAPAQWFKLYWKYVLQKDIRAASRLWVNAPIIIASALAQYYAVEGKQSNNYKIEYNTATEHEIVLEEVMEYCITANIRAHYAVSDTVQSPFDVAVAQDTRFEITLTEGNK